MILLCMAVKTHDNSEEGVMSDGEAEPSAETYRLMPPPSIGSAHWENTRATRIQLIWEMRKASRARDPYVRISVLLWCRNSGYRRRVSSSLRVLLHALLCFPVY